MITLPGNKSLLLGCAWSQYPCEPLSIVIVNVLPSNSAGAVKGPFCIMPVMISNFAPTEESSLALDTVLLKSNCCVKTSGYTLLPNEQLQVIFRTSTISPALAPCGVAVVIDTIPELLS